MKVAIVGSREFDPIRRGKVHDYVCTLQPGDWVISGGAQGVDTWAVNAARIRGIPYLVFPVDLRDIDPNGPRGKAEFARRAFARNRAIVEQADRVVAFHNGTSGGTKNTIRLANELGKPVEVIL